MKIAITGHRPNKLGNDYDLTSPLILSIKKEIIDNLKAVRYAFPNLTLITGMALGIDTLFAQIAIDLNIPFIAAIPFIGQETKWNDKTRQEYHNLLNKSYNIMIVDRGYDVTYPAYLERRNMLIIDKQLHNQYSPAKMQQRNIWMVDNCDILIAVWDGSSGGTANCVKYAESVNKQIIRINPKEL
jgi:uncharacterized phage-like protein YoqJ